MSPLTYIWTCLISYEWAECLAEGRGGERRRRRARDRSRKNKCVYERQRDRLRTHGVVKAALFDYSPLYRLPVRRGHVGKRGMIQLKTTPARSWARHSDAANPDPHHQHTPLNAFIKHHQDTASLKTIKWQPVLWQGFLGRQAFFKIIVFCQYLLTLTWKPVSATE